jgi:hypothetical protein
VCKIQFQVKAKIHITYISEVMLSVVAALQKKEQISVCAIVSVVTFSGQVFSAPHLLPSVFIFISPDFFLNTVFCYKCPSFCVVLCVMTSPSSAVQSV